MRLIREAGLVDQRVVDLTSAGRRLRGRFGPCSRSSSSWRRGRSSDVESPSRAGGRARGSRAARCGRAGSQERSGHDPDGRGNGSPGSNGRRRFGDLGRDRASPRAGPRAGRGLRLRGAVQRDRPACPPGRDDPDGGRHRDGRVHGRRRSGVRRRAESPARRRLHAVRRAPDRRRVQQSHPSRLAGRDDHDRRRHWKRRLLGRRRPCHGSNDRHAARPRSSARRGFFDRGHEQRADPAGLAGRSHHDGGR